jgi:purine-binding chemotaxis protein CheW
MSATAQLENRTEAESEMDQHLNYSNQYVSFWIDGQLLGVPVSSVQEVLNPQQIARTPQARPEIAGLLNLRGQIVTAVNLRKRMNLPDRDEDQPDLNVVVRHKGESFSLLVDEVGDVINVSSETMEPVPHTLDAHWKSMTDGVFRLEDRLFIILNVNAALNIS